MHVVILANGPIRSSGIVASEATRGDLLIAADGGARHARRLGLHPHVLIGDMDSLTLDEFSEFQRNSIEVIRHPPQKDKTDLELALDLAVERGAVSITLLGALGDRWDMTLANIMIMAADRFAALDIRIVDGNQNLRVLRGPGELALSGAKGDGLSLIPISARVCGVTLAGTVYPLAAAQIERGSTWGISNVLDKDRVGIQLQEGILIVIHTLMN